jgi:hypothetical protein
MPSRASSLDPSSHEVELEIPRVSCTSLRLVSLSPHFPLNIFCRANNKYIKV